MKDTNVWQVILDKFVEVIFENDPATEIKKTTVRLRPDAPREWAIAMAPELVVVKDDVPPPGTDTLQELVDFIKFHTVKTPPYIPGCADVHFFGVRLVSRPCPIKLTQLIEKNNKGDFATVNLFDENEHGYIELGAWIGSQEIALRLMGMGKLLGLWSLMTPGSEMPFLSPEMQDEAAGQGLITIQYKAGA